MARLFRLDEKKDMLTKNLPQGDKKMLDVASAFALHPEVILLDEPTSGVSTSDKNKFMETLVSASKKIGMKSIVQVEHDMDIVFSFSDRIIALHQGKILSVSTPAEIEKNEEVVCTVMGQKECFKILADYWLRGQATNPRFPGSYYVQARRLGDHNGVPMDAPTSLRAFRAPSPGALPPWDWSA